MINVYTDAYRLSQKELYKRTVREIINYLQNQMSDNGGGFYSAEDADSEGVEGKFYVWTADEIRKILRDDANKFIELFNIKDNGNYFSETGEYNNSLNIPHLKTVDILTEKDYEFIERCRKKLHNARQERVRPLKDDKILTDWNGMLLAALAKAGFVFNNDEYINLAKSCADFLTGNLYNKSENKLYHRYRKGEIGIEGMLDDYVFLSSGLIELYFATGDIKYFEKALMFTDYAIKLFFDEEQGGFYKTASTAELILTRKKEIYDGAMPSANSVMLMNLAKLYSLTGNEQYKSIADLTIRYFAEKIQEYPAGYTAFMQALFFSFHGTPEIILVGNKTKENYQRFLDIIRKHKRFGTVLMYLDNEREISKYADWTSGIPIDNKKSKVIFCENFVCHEPIENPEELKKLLLKSLN